MKNLSLNSVLCVATVVFFVGTLILEASARGRGGGGRGGGVRISRSGPASGGSFSSRSSQARSAARTQYQQQVTPSDVRTRQDARTDIRVERRSNLSEATEGSLGQLGDRQEYRGERRKDRYDYREDTREDWQDYHDGHYRYYDDDWDNWVGYAAAGTAVVTSAAVVGSTVSESKYEELSCTPEKVEVEGISYVKCGENWYMPTYKGGEIVYVVVNPPPGY